MRFYPPQRDEKNAARTSPQHRPALFGLCHTSRLRVHSVPFSPAWRFSSFEFPFRSPSRRSLPSRPRGRILKHASRAQDLDTNRPAPAARDREPSPAGPRTRRGRHTRRASRPRAYYSLAARDRWVVSSDHDSPVVLAFRVDDELSLGPSLSARPLRHGIERDGLQQGEHLVNAGLRGKLRPL